MKCILIVLSFIFIFSCSFTKENIIIGDSLVYRNDWLIDDYSHGGWKIEDLQNNVDSYKMYDDIFILIGINNICHGWTDEEILKELEFLCNSIGSNIYIISILPIVDIDFHWGDNDRIKNLNNDIKKKIHDDRCI